MKKEKRKKYNWRAQLTPDELAFIEEAEAGAKVIADLQSAWNQKYQLERMKIVNRAVQRAIYQEGRGE